MGWSEKGSQVCLLPSGSLLLCAGAAKPSAPGSFNMQCFSAETWALGALWTLTEDTIAHVLHLPVRMPALLGTLVHSTFFILALGHAGTSVCVYQECYLQHDLPNHVLFPFPLYCGSSLLATGTLCLVFPASRWEVGHKAL